MALLLRTKTETPTVTNLFDNFFDDFFTPNRLKNHANLGNFQPKVDLIEKENAYQVLVDLPGLDEKEIDLTLTEDSLVVKGERKSEKQEEKENRWYFERSFGEFQRMIPLPSEIAHEQVNAKFKNGVLTVDLPKSANAKNRVRKITVN